LKGDAGLGAGAEVAQPAIDPSVVDHLRDRRSALLVEGDIGDTAGIGLIEIVAAGIAAIGGDLVGRGAATSDMALERSASTGLPASMTRSRIKPL
jgi:hypothetical protein